jgi:hypothetical protein
MNGQPKWLDADGGPWMVGALKAADYPFGTVAAIGHGGAPEAFIVSRVGGRRAWRPLDEHRATFSDGPACDAFPAGAFEYAESVVIAADATDALCEAFEPFRGVTP